MIVGIGVDVCECTRMSDALARQGEKFARRICRDAEWLYCAKMKDPSPSLAARFAAKEALRKALAKTPALSWHDVEVRHGEFGEPSLILYGEAKSYAKDFGVEKIHLSLSHERSVAVAMVVLEGS